MAVIVRVIAGAVRFTCHILLGMYGGTRVSMFTKIVKHRHTLLAPPLNYSVVMAAEQFAGVWGIIAFIWNFVMWIPSCSCGHYIFLLCVGVVDTLLVLFLLLATILESVSIRKTHIQCGEIFAGPASDAGILFFQRFKATDWGEDDIVAACDSFNMGFYMGIPVIILYTIAAISELYFGMKEAWQPYQYRSRRRDISRRKAAVIALRRIATSFPRLLLSIFIWIFSLLPWPVKVELHFRGRILSKWLYHRLSLIQMMLGGIVRRVQTKPSKRGGNTAMVKALQSARVVKAIARNVHHLDLVNLSLASKEVHSSILAVGKEAEKIQSLRELTCTADSRAECFTCGVQVCEDCCSLRSLRQTTFAEHMRLCKARCSDCYHARVVPPHYQCKCVDSRSEKVRVFHDKYVCRSCTGKKDADLLKLRTRFLQQSRRKLKLDQGLACDTCSRTLPETGSLWWVCSKCSAECPSHHHPGWGAKLSV